MTRTVAVGYVTEEMERVYNTVLAAQLAGIAGLQSRRSRLRGGRRGSARLHCRRRLWPIPAMAMATAWAWKFMRPQTVMLPIKLMPLEQWCSAEPGIYLPGEIRCPD